MLVAVYQADGRAEEARRCRRLGDAQAREQARRALGSPPTRRDMKVLADVLLQKWAPSADVEHLRDLAYVVQLSAGRADRTPLRGKRDIVDFLRRRNRTE